MTNCYRLLYTVIYRKEEEILKIIISNNSSIPLYEQIKEAIKKEIVTGNLKDGEKLPSVRSLSRDLKISILTVKKAYDELVEEGFIETRQGLGSFVSGDNSHLKQEEKNKALEGKIIEIVKIAKSLKVSQKDLGDLINFIYEGDVDD